MSEVPDRTFVKRLKQLDKKLSCIWNEKVGKFVITYERVVGPAWGVMMIERTDGRFRQPDIRDLNRLKESDTHRIGVEEWVRKGEDYMREYQEKAEKSRDDLFKELTADSKIQLTNAFVKAGNLGKANSTFRRIDPKMKGKIYK